jgi:hypothetical protein
MGGLFMRAIALDASAVGLVNRQPWARSIERGGTVDVGE